MVCDLPLASSRLVLDRSYLLARQIMADLLLQLFAYALGGNGIEVGVGEDLVDDGAVCRMLLERDCSDILLAK